RRICRARAHPAPAPFLALPHLRSTAVMAERTVGMVAACRLFNRNRPLRIAALVPGHQAWQLVASAVCSDWRACMVGFRVRLTSRADTGHNLSDQVAITTYQVIDIS